MRLLFALSNPHKLILLWFLWTTQSWGTAFSLPPPQRYAAASIFQDQHSTSRRATTVEQEQEQQPPQTNENVVPVASDATIPLAATTATDTSTTTTTTRSPSRKSPLWQRFASSSSSSSFSKRAPIRTRTKRQYNWKDFVPGGGLANLRWLITGSSLQSTETDVDMRHNLHSLARLLLLLREYETLYGHELANANANVKDDNNQALTQQVLSEITQDLYASGTPTWVLSAVMERVAEGLTGRTGVEFMFLPRRALLHYPNDDGGGNRVDLFKLVPGFDIYKLGAVEQVAVRLASFASNTNSIERLSAESFRMPGKYELLQVERQEIYNTTQTTTDGNIVFTNETNGELNGATPIATTTLPAPSEYERERLAKEILDLASSTYGLFFFLNSPTFQAAANRTYQIAGDVREDDRFWQVDDSTRRIFTRLAAQEAAASLQRIHAEETSGPPLYSPRTVKLFRILGAAGACSTWFGGSWADMAVSGVLVVAVASIISSKTLAYEERILTEVVASFFVGLVAGLLSLRFPKTFCFGAIAMSGVIDLFQGFKVVYAVIEIMSKNAVSGVARMMEGILFTGLISYSLKFGLDVAFRIVFGANAPLPQDVSNFMVSARAVSKWFYPLLIPVAALGWAGLFRPGYADLPLMMFHACMAFGLSLAGAPLFVAAMCVTLSAGILSRFTGREALGNTLAGLYALAPGAYMVKFLLGASKIGFLEGVLTSTVTLGLGAWTGTILCSPTILGKTSGLHGWAFARNTKEEMKDPNKNRAMLYF